MGPADRVVVVDLWAAELVDIGGQELGGLQLGGFGDGDLVQGALQRPLGGGAVVANDLHGVSTGKVDDLVRALGADSGISNSEVSRICADLDGEVSAFWDRSLAGQAFPYVLVDATFCKASVNRRVVGQAVAIATGVWSDGRREVLGFAVGDSEDGAFWTAFLGSLKAGGLGGCSWSSPTPTSGCARPSRPHDRRHRPALPGPLPPQRAGQSAQGSAEMVAAAIRAIFAQPDATQVHQQLDVIAGCSDASSQARGDAV